MRKNLLALVLICTMIPSVRLLAQPFAAGSTVLNVYDSTRTGGSAIAAAPNWGNAGRAIGVQIFYPATAAGAEAAPASGQFPVVIFGHGFVMTYDSYSTLYEALAAEGFVVALPVTEGGFSPVHADFAADLAFLARKLPQLNNNGVLPLLQGRIAPRAAIGGHSMGAGCSMIGARNNQDIFALFNLATAESNTSGISSLAGAPDVSAPTLILSGERDCVTDTSVQRQHYDALGSSLKYLPVLRDLTHCDFGNGNSLTCTLGQNSAGCPNTVANVQAGNAVLHYLLPFLQRCLKNDCIAADTFMKRVSQPDAGTAGMRFAGDLRCYPASVSKTEMPDMKVYPNPATDFWTIERPNQEPVRMALYDALGRCLWQAEVQSEQYRISCASWPPGHYRLHLQNAQTSRSFALLKAE